VTVQDCLTNITDPRPDLVKDSGLWIRLLTLAAREFPALCEPLESMRKNGTRLKKLNKGGKYGLRPQVGRGCWKNAAAYKEKAAQLLKPHHKQLVDLLSRFAVQVARELSSPDEDERFQAKLEINGIVAIKILDGEIVYFVRDKWAAAEARIPKQAVIYTLEELKLLADSQLDKTGLKKLHEAKKAFNGTIIEAPLNVQKMFAEDERGFEALNKADDLMVI